MSDKELNFRKLKESKEKWKDAAGRAMESIEELERDKELLEAKVEGLANGTPEAIPTDERISALEEERDQWKSKAEALEPAVHRGVLVEAGFNPDSAEAKVLARDLEDGAIEPGESESMVDAVKRHAGDEYSWDPSVRVYTAREHEMSESANRLSELQSVTFSEKPAPSIDTEIEETQEALNAARAAKQWEEASAISTRLQQLATQKMYTSIQSHM